MSELDIARAPTVSALWAYAGLHVVDGRAAELYEPAPGFWAARRLKPETLAALRGNEAARAEAHHAEAADVLHAIVNAREAVAAAGEAAQAIRVAIASGREPALDGALEGALWGALYGASSLPGGAVASLARSALLEQFAARLAGRAAASSTDTGTSP